MSFNKRVVDYQNITDYAALKGMIQSVNSDPDKKTVNKIAYNIDVTTGALTGAFTVTYYSLTGTDRVYVPKDFGEYEVGGIENLFIEVELEEEED